jgi:hypothetical protein
VRKFQASFIGEILKILRGLIKFSKAEIAIEIAAISALGFNQIET